MELLQTFKVVIVNMIANVAAADMALKKIIFIKDQVFVPGED